MKRIIAGIILTLFVFLIFAALGAFEKVYSQWDSEENAPCRSAPSNTPIEQYKPPRPGIPYTLLKPQSNILLFYKSIQNKYQHTPVTFKTACPIKGGEIIIEAFYSDDGEHAMAPVRFEINGVGGYIGVERTSNGEFVGDGMVQKGNSGIWTYDLSKIKIARQEEAGSREVNFVNIINKNKIITLHCWVDGGRNSWVSVRLFTK